MNLSDYLKEAKQTQEKFANALGVTQGMVGFWLKGKPPTVERCIQIEKLTAGQVRCEDLRPDIDWQYLRCSGKKAA